MKSETSNDSTLGTRRARISSASCRRIAVLFIFTVLCPAVDIRAVGLRLPNQDPEAIARGNAFAATADNPSAIYYNPAGITQMEGQNLSAGLYLLSAGDTFESTTGATASTKTDFQPVP